MESFTLGRLARSIGVPTPAGQCALRLSSVSTDTRTLRPGGLYVALKGTRFDGAQFVAQGPDMLAPSPLPSRPDPGHE